MTDAKARIDRVRKENEERVILFRQQFNTPHGEAVIDALNTKFSTHLPSHIPLPEDVAKSSGKLYDPIHAALREGQRSVINYIEQMRKIPAKGNP